MIQMVQYQLAIEMYDMLSKFKIYFFFKSNDNYNVKSEILFLK
jgi:hypothetical protein